MTLELGSRAALLLLAIVPLVWIVARASGVPARRHPLLVALRSLVLVGLIGALAQPILLRSASEVALICLVDGSHSVSSGALNAAASSIDEIATALGPDHLRLVAFGSRTARLADVATLRRLSTQAGRDELDRLVSAEGTNLEQALAAARREIPPGTSARLVLFSDGHETDGRSRRVLERLAAEHVPVFTRTLAVRDVGDTWIDAVRVPHGALAEAVTMLEVVVGSQAVRPVQIVVRESTRELARTHLDAGLGTTIASIEVRFDTAGPHLITAELTAGATSPDVLDENNRLEAEVLVEPRPRLLYVHSEKGVVPTAARVLAEAGVQVTDAQPGALPIEPDAFDQWDVVLLSNPARAALTTEVMAALATWVEERGGGLLFAGGPPPSPPAADADAPDFRRTEIERILPITFDPEDEPDVVLLIVLDRSWSMNGPAMELSKTAAEAAANTLAPAHVVGVLTFSNQPTWDVPLARLREIRPTLHDAIARIRASGPTDIYLALTQAHEALAGIRARAKHLILLSDGQTEAADFEGLMRQMTEARVTVSSVALGGEADVALLRNLATWGGGRSYVVQDAREVPEIFVKEAKSAASDGADERDGIRPAAGATRLLRQHGDFPPLQAYMPVTRKPGAVDLLTTARDEPLLTVWPAGLGRTAMFAADLDGRWTRDWLAWRGFGAFLGTIVRSLAPRRLPPRTLDIIAGERHGSRHALEVTLEARDRDGQPENLLRPLVDVRDPSGPLGRLELLQVAPGRYASSLVAHVDAPVTFSLADVPSGPGSARIFVVDQAAEYRFGMPDERHLAAIARATGGTADATVEDIRAAVRPSGTARRPLAPWLLLGALVCWLLDVAVRRIVRSHGPRIALFRSES